MRLCPHRRNGLVDVFEGDASLDQICAECGCSMCQEDSE